MLPSFATTMKIPETNLLFWSCIYASGSLLVNDYYMMPWCNGYRRRKWTRWHEFKSWTRLITFHIAIIPLGKVWMPLFSLQLWVNSRADWVQSCPGFELVSPCPFPTTITITPRHLQGLGKYHIIWFRPNILGCPRGVMVKALDCGIVISDFELQLRHCVNFRKNTLWNSITPVLLDGRLWH